MNNLESRINKILFKHFGSKAGNEDVIKDMMSTESLNYVDAMESIDHVNENSGDSISLKDLKMEIIEAAVEELDPSLYTNLMKAKDSLNTVLSDIEVKYENKINSIAGRFNDKTKQVSEQEWENFMKTSVQF